MLIPKYDLWNIKKENLGLPKETASNNTQAFFLRGLFLYLPQTKTMLLFGLTTEEMAFFTDISKTVIPLFAALGGAMTGSYLTYRFQRSDKIRDHLFSYKAKSYSNLAQRLTITMGDIISLNNDIKYCDNIDSYRKKPREISQELTEGYSDYYIFLSDNVLKGIRDLKFKMDKAFHNVYFREEELSDDSLDQLFKDAYDECSKLLSLLKDELEIYRINKSRYK